MSKRPGDTDTKPWYRQFWFWFIMALPASVVVAGLGTLYIAHDGADDLVVDEYYKNGLAINQQLEKKELAEHLNIEASLEFSAYSVAANLSGDIAEQILTLTLSHPLEADRDFSVELARVESGFYAGSLDRALSGRWHWTLENQQSPQWRLDGSVTLSSDSNDHPSPD